MAVTFLHEFVICAIFKCYCGTFAQKVFHFFFGKRIAEKAENNANTHTQKSQREIMKQLH